MPRDVPLPLLCGLAACLAACLAGPAAAGPFAEGGAYEIAVRLDLPHLADATATRRLRLCLPEAAGEPALGVLSENNPLARCPAANLRREGDVLTFDIACQGRNAATALARYERAAGLLRGRIEMRMSGKNMTMTETQLWRRIGSCAPGEAPAP